MEDLSLITHRLLLTNAERNTLMAAMGSLMTATTIVTPGANISHMTALMGKINNAAEIVIATDEIVALARERLGDNDDINIDEDDKEFIHDGVRYVPELNDGCDGCAFGPDPGVAKCLTVPHSCTDNQYLGGSIIWIKHEVR